MVRPNDDLDFGNGFTGHWVGWSPDRELNPQYDGIPDIKKCTLLITCRHGNQAGLSPDTPEVRRIFPDGPHWQVESWEPLTLSPSILKEGCGCHGYIREGRWIDA